MSEADTFDRRAFKVAMDAFYAACPGDVSHKRSVEAAIRAYLRAASKQADARQAALL